MEKSCGAVVYRLENGNREYLILHYSEGHWDFPKGHVEQDETEEQTARRETKEEAGIADLEFAPLFRETISYFYTKEHRKIYKEVVFFLARTGGKEARMSDEHVGYGWLGYAEAVERLTHKNAKEILGKAEAYLSATVHVGAEDL